MPQSSRAHLRIVPPTLSAPEPERRLSAVLDVFVRSPLAVAALAAATLGVDFLLGPYIAFPVFYVLPVMLAAWHHGPRLALAMAVAMPGVRLGYNHYWDVPWASFEAWINCGSRIAVLSTIAVLTARTAAQTRELAREVRMLEGLLPICSHCKRIRDEGNRWERLEQYISARSQARFTHSICPGCLHHHYADYAD